MFLVFRPYLVGDCYDSWHRNKVIIIIISSITVFAGVLVVHQPCANHALGASVTQVNHSVHTLSTFLRIRADPSMQIFWISVTVALSDTFLMFSTIPFFTVPSAPTTTGITTVFICHILCISSSRSLHLLFFSISFSAMFLSDGTVILISFQVEFTESLTMMSGLFAVIVLSIDWHVPHDGDVVVFIVHHSLWLVLVPFVCNLDIIIFTDAPMEICWRCTLFLLLPHIQIQYGSTVSSCCEHILHLLSTCWPHITFW